MILKAQFRERSYGGDPIQYLTGEGLCDPDFHALLNLVDWVSLEFAPWARNIFVDSVPSLRTWI